MTRLPTWIFIALAITLWFATTLALFGDTGKFSDDYVAHMVHPVTGNVDLHRHPWARWPYFWRPLHLAHVSVMNTLSWNHPWIGHVELAIVHLGVCVMLYLAMRQFGVKRLTAYCVAMLFMVCPLHAEAVLWTSASCNAISCVFLLWMVLLTRRWAADPLRASRVALAGVLAFVIACWYEPAAGALLAMPLAARAGLPRGLARSERLRRVWIPTLVALSACAAYVALLLLTAPGGARGDATSLVSVGQIPARFVECVTQVIDATVGSRGEDVCKGGYLLCTGAGTAGGLMWWGVFLRVVGMGSVAAALYWLLKGGPIRSVHELRAHGGGLITCGCAIAVGSMVPVALTLSPGLDLRTLCVPLLGVAMATAGAVDVLDRLLAHRDWMHAKAVPFVICTVTAITGMSWAIACVGFQYGFRQQARLDASITHRLAQLIPDPPPGTVFMLLAIDAHAAKTGRPGFDDLFRGGYELPSTITPILRHAYHRLDVSGIALTYRLGGDVPILNVKPDGFDRRHVRGGRNLGSTSGEGATRIAWSRVRPFVVDTQGSLRPVTAINVVPRVGEPFAVATWPAARGIDVALYETDRGTCEVRGWK